MTAQALFDRIRQLRILVVGDLMLDRYLWGDVSRISPEAPVPVVDVRKEENRLGGAANVALNLHSLGAAPVLLGIVGKDTEGEAFHDLVLRMGLPNEGVMVSRERRTTTKVRVIGNNQQMLRVDREDRHTCSEAERGQLMALVRSIFATQRLDAVVFEDYDKGLLTGLLIEDVVRLARQQNIPTFVDPKFNHFFCYSGVTVFKPNLKELREALKLELRSPELADLAQAVGLVRERMPHAYTLLTLSERGVLLVDEHLEVHHSPAHPRKIADVSGAGDTVIAVMAACMSAGMDVRKAAKAANFAGGLVCEEVGVVPIRPNLLQSELLVAGLISQ